jgi:molybdopterin converting factor small subunit
MATVLFFGPARDAVGERSAIVEGACVGDVVAATVAQYGERLAALLPTCRVWLNGDPAEPDSPVCSGDEVAVLPPVSGG